MYKYTKRALLTNLLFAVILLYLIVVVDVDLIFKIVIGLVFLIIAKDAYNEFRTTFELTGDRLIVRLGEKVKREILYKEMKYLTITRKNKKWAVIADDNGILFTIKPRIESYDNMISKLIELNKSNRKLEVHDYLKKTYKK